MPPGLPSAADGSLGSCWGQCGAFPWTHKSLRPFFFLHSKSEKPSLKAGCKPACSQEASKTWESHIGKSGTRLTAGSRTGWSRVRRASLLAFLIVWGWATGGVTILGQCGLWLVVAAALLGSGQPSWRPASLCPFISLNPFFKALRASINIFLALEKGLTPGTPALHTSPARSPPPHSLIQISPPARLSPRPAKRGGF